MFLFMGILCERVCVMRRALAWEEGGKGEGSVKESVAEGEADICMCSFSA